MSYRDESEALRAHVAKLEGELATAEAKIATLEGRTAGAGAEGERLTHSRLLGAPSAIVLERELAFEIDDEGYEAIAAAVQARFAVQASQVGRSLHASHAVGQFLSITREGDRTRVRVAASWSFLKGGPIAGGGLLGLFAAGATGGVMSDIAHTSPGARLLGVAAAAAATAVSIGWLLRGRAKKLANRNLERYRGLFETVLALAEKHAIRKDDIQARVAAVEHDEVEVEAREAVERAR